jgi:Tol biopolymer transport system component
VWREVERSAWLKDGTGLLTVAASNGTSENRQIWLIDVPDGKERRITNDLSNYDISVRVTADANEILAVEHQQINNVWIAPADDLTRAKQITFGALNNGGGGSGIDWLPNGKILYVERVAQSATLWTMDADGSNARELTPTGANDLAPSVTADGRTIVFESNRGGTEDIWRVNSDGNNPVKLTTCGKNTEPSVSPDGQWVVYRSECDATQALWRVSINGGQPTRMTNAPGSWPWISPDSKWVACDYDAGGKSQLAIISIEGGPPLKLFDVATLANFRFGIRWTPDGKAVTYRDWGKGIWRQSLDGGAPQQLVGLPEEKIYSYAWSRDGKLFAFSRGVEIRDVVVLTTQR